MVQEPQAVIRPKVVRKPSNFVDSSSERDLLQQVYPFTRAQTRDRWVGHKGVRRFGVTFYLVLFIFPELASPQSTMALVEGNGGNVLSETLVA